MFQSTDQKMIYGRIYGFFLLGSPTTTPPPPPPIAFSRLAVLYGQKIDLWTNLRIFSYSVRLLRWVYTSDAVMRRHTMRRFAALAGAVLQASTCVSVVVKSINARAYKAWKS